ncbi:MAG: D-alanyl-D-alanine carboxypeptidase/D-alanyl-D-alanine-endopeptidase [Gemmatimonadales bacterium]|nr:D-alanyl-D-alanine carboxypeptidase/D-alanyl-D-alanine-endopeptidase [Gemmatimonadales bacterium]
MTEALGRPARSALRTLLLVGALGASSRGADAQSLAKRLDARMDAAPFNRLLWGVALVDERGKLLYGRNADRLFIPASNTKLVVSAIASALFDPNFTVQTSVYAAGTVTDSVLHGDLVLYGRGDPTFGVRCYAVDTTAAGACDRDPATRIRQLADSLRARGIRTVDGNIVGDGSYFSGELVRDGWNAYDLNWWYAAPVSALGFNDNSIDIAWRPGAVTGAPAVLSFKPDFGDVTLENRTQTAPAGGRNDIGDRIYRIPGTLHLWAEGTAALGGRGGTDYFALPDPDLFTAQALRAALAEAGVSVIGSARSTTDSMLYRAARATPPLAEVASRPFHQWIFPILNTSQNWFAEMTLKQLGKRFGTAGSWDEGLRVERRFLIDSVGVDSTEFALSDGSGLAASNLISPRAFTQLLRFIRRHPRYQTFVAGLPHSGERGSLRTRFVGTPLEGKVRAKTGSIARVNTLSGYIELPAGRTLTFSVQANHHTLPTRAILSQIDSIVVQMGK